MAQVLQGSVTAQSLEFTQCLDTGFDSGRCCVEPEAAHCSRDAPNPGHSTKSSSLFGRTEQKGKQLSLQLREDGTSIMYIL